MKDFRNAVNDINKKVKSNVTIIQIELDNLVKEVIDLEKKKVDNVKMESIKITISNLIRKTLSAFPSSELIFIKLNPFNNLMNTKIDDLVKVAKTPITQ